MNLRRRDVLRLLAAAPALGWARPADAAPGRPVVGLITSMTGSGATFGIAASRGAALAFEDAVTLVTLDDRSTPVGAIAAAEELLARPDVVAVLGPVMSSAAIVCGPRLQQAGVPMVCTTSTNPAITRIGDRVFRTCLTDPQQGRVLATYLRGRELSRAALLVEAMNDYATGIADVFAPSFEQGGGKVVAFAGYASHEIDFKAPLSAALAAKPDALVIPGYYTEVALAARQARELGYTGLFAGGDGWDSDYLYEIGREAIVGGIYTNHFAADDPASADFTNRFREAHGVLADPVAALTYDAAGVVRAALGQAARRNPAGLVALRDAVRDEIAATRDHPSVTGPLSLGPDREATRAAVIVEVTPTGPRFLARVD